MEILLLHQLANTLGYKDARSARRWCIKNGVTILKDNGTRRCYVIAAEFEAVRQKAFITSLKRRFGEKEWLKAYTALLDSDVRYLSLLGNSGGSDQLKERGKNPSAYTTSQNAQKFICDLNIFLNK